MTVIRPRKQGKKFHVSKPKGGRKGYRKYFHEQPSKKIVFVEEPDSEGDEESSEELEEELERTSTSDSSDYSSEEEFSGEDEDLEEDYEIYFDGGRDAETGEEVYLVNLSDLEQLASDEDLDLSSEDEMTDLNDELEDAVDVLEADGKVYDLNDDLLRYYDDEDEDDEYESYDEPVDILDIVDLNDQLQAELIAQGTTGESSSSSSLDSELSYSSDEELLNDQLQLENVRQSWLEDCEESSSSNSDSSVSDIDMIPESELGSELSELDETSSSDEDGVTIYEHKFDLPESFQSESESESESDSDETSDEECDDDHCLLTANDSDDELEVIDLSDDLENSKDCELTQIDDNIYKLNLRIPSIVKDELKLDFLKSENKLIIKGKLNINIDSDYESADEQYTESESDSESDLDSEDSESSESSYSDSSYSSSSDDEEIHEDYHSLVKEFKNQEIPFEKHFTFEEPIIFEGIRAKFLKNGELEVIIPSEEAIGAQDSDKVAIEIDSDSEDDSFTEEME
ncbi:uncharacterized protein PRCAT00003859001 [Priceomyces carsonii]|uniref:uncharacterized protein n=1 Tax=Priceomyces carsonii TaxID=28549 RepID=UPI002ED81EA4|nr:unnamed protein product [Priceomyces carsonii]